MLVVVEVEVLILFLHVVKELVELVVVELVVVLEQLV
tara:strand:+ start:518 stop:628 length:111 start_codon:yes stop_codon:yes gene_type:complete